MEEEHPVILHNYITSEIAAKLLSQFKDPAELLLALRDICHIAICELTETCTPENRGVCRMEYVDTLFEFIEERLID